MGQVQLRFKERLLLGDETDVVQQQDLPFLQTPDRLPGGGTAHVVDPLDLPAQQLRQHGGMGLGGVEILILDVASLMGHEHQFCALVRKLPDGGHAGADAVDALERAGCPIHRLVDVHPAEDGLALYVQLIQGSDSKTHGPALTS